MLTQYQYIHKSKRDMERTKYKADDDNGEQTLGEWTLQTGTCL